MNLIIHFINIYTLDNLNLINNFFTSHLNIYLIDYLLHVNDLNANIKIQHMNSLKLFTNLINLKKAIIDLYYIFYLNFFYLIYFIFFRNIMKNPEMII